jgi:hypothetical protein
MDKNNNHDWYLTSFFKLESASSIILMVAAVLALIAPSLTPNLDLFIASPGNIIAALTELLTCAIR